MQKPKRIAILGPESTGKSTLAAALAAYFQEPWVPEVAREYLEKLHRPYAFVDLLKIGRQQMQLEDELAGELTLAISKFLCKENAGAILKPLLISNE